jgi:transposase
MHENDVLATRIREILGVSRASVFEWIAKYREGGLAAISASNQSDPLLICGVSVLASCL